MKNYENYTLEDFLEDEKFRVWVLDQRVHNNFWKTFLIKYPEKGILMREAEMLLKVTSVEKLEISDKEIRAEVELFLERIGDSAIEIEQLNSLANDSPTYFSFTLYHWISFLVACCTLCIGLNWNKIEESLVRQNNVNSLGGNENLVKTTNNTARPLEIMLSDSSYVILSPNSTLNYPIRFEDSIRTVYLEGEAHFSVTQKGKSFIVIADKVVTKVLGTKFIVRAYNEDKNITVQVETGKVHVSTAENKKSPVSDNAKGVIITANQAAVFEKKINQLSKTLVQTPISIKTHLYGEISKYEEVPLPIILEELASNYGIPIQFNRLNFQNCRLTANIVHEDLYETLNILCKAVSATYEIIDGHIIINGEGCD